MTYMVTGGAGFIGSALVRELVQTQQAPVVNVDKLTYAGDPSTVAAVADAAHYRFVQADIADAEAMARLFEQQRPTVVFNLAAESHVDRSIEAPDAFIHTNVVGTYHLLCAATRYWQAQPDAQRERFRFIHVSTDEVFGTLGSDGKFTEATPYRPNSPYSASKAGSDHLVRAWCETYGLPALITNCSNNYGPYQFPEKLIPLMVRKACRGEALPVYGDGRQVRDWLFVEDHVAALLRVAAAGRPGTTYNIGGNNERANIDVVRTLCALLAELRPEGGSRTDYEALITHVPDRPGHDLRYAIDSTKILRELDWSPNVTFEEGLRKTVAWILANAAWYDAIARTRYGGERIGLTDATADARP